MENYPGNQKVGPEEPRKRRVEPVVTNRVTRHKKSLGSRFRETFFSGSSAKSVWGNVFFEVMIPAGKDLVMDSLTQTIRGVLYGEGPSPRRSPQTGSGTIVNYNRMSSGPSRSPSAIAPSAPRARANDFEDVVFETRMEADDVLEALYTVLQKYEQVTVSDFNDLINVTGSWTDEKWGWTDLRGSRVTRTNHGYLLVLPSPEHLYK